MAYSRGKITIPNISGNIVISVTTKIAEIVNLFIKTPQVESTSTADASDVVSLAARLNSSGKAVRYNTVQLLTRYIDASAGDVVRLVSDTANNTNAYTGNIACYNASNTYIGTISYTSTSIVDHSSDYKTITFHIPSGTWNGADYSGTAKVRICAAYSDIDSIVITKV